MFYIRHTHSSSRYDRLPRTLLWLLRVAVQRSDLITFTEVANDKRAAALEWMGWERIQSPEPGGLAECAVMVRSSVWRVDGWRVVRLSRLRIARRGGQYNWCLVVFLTHRRTKRSGVVAVVHMPSGIQEGAGFEEDSENLHATANFHLSCDNLSTRALRWKERFDFVLLTGDWNIDARLATFRSYIRDVFPGSSQTWGVQRPDRGTYGKRLIDFSVMWGLRVERARVMRIFAASDHRPFWERLAGK